MKQLPLVASFILFIALCATLAFWGLQLFKPAARNMLPPPITAVAEIRLDTAAAIFGGRPAAMAVASNYELKGVVMSELAGESAAILSADGKPAAAIPLGKEVIPGVTVKEVHPLYVLLDEGGVTKRVDLPESARGQSSMLVTAPIPTSPVPAATTLPETTAQGGNPMAPGPITDSTSVLKPIPGSPGVRPGGPPKSQAGASANPQAAPGADNGVINIPAPNR